MRIGIYLFTAAIGTGCASSKKRAVPSDTRAGEDGAAVEPPELRVRASPVRKGQPIELKGGAAFICAERHDADIACFGNLDLYDPERQFVSYSKERLVPAVLSGFRDVEVAAADYSRCLLDQGGRTWCWGLSQSLATFPLAAPWLQVALPPVRDVSTDGSTCIAAIDGEVWCWGRPTCTPYTRGQPVNRWMGRRRIEGVQGAIAVGVSDATRCAVLEDGHVQCWGSKAFDTQCKQTETWTVPGITDAVEVGLSHEAACVRTASGTIACWGGNRFDFLGLGDEETSITTPQEIEGLEDAVKLSVEEANACALTADGEVWCWGSGFKSPAPISEAGTAIDVVAGNDFACALSPDHRVRCFGERIDRGRDAGLPPSAFETDEAWTQAKDLWPGLSRRELVRRGAVESFRREADRRLATFIHALETRCEELEDCVAKWPAGAGPTLIGPAEDLDPYADWQTFLQGVSVHQPREGFEVSARPSADGRDFVARVRYESPVFDRRVAAERRCRVKEGRVNGVKKLKAWCDLESKLVEEPRKVSFQMD